MDTNDLMPEPCRRCGVTLVRTVAWRKADQTQRTIWTHAGYTQQSARNLCGKCWHTARRDGTLIDYERRTVPAETVREEWEATVGVDVPYGERQRHVRELAPRLGMTVNALEKALDRLGIGTPQPVGLKLHSSSYGSCKACRNYALHYRELTSWRQRLMQRIGHAVAAHHSRARQQLDEANAELDKLHDDWNGHRALEHDTEAVAA